MDLKSKIIAFDVDGTLASSNADVSEYSAKVISDLVSEGYQITLITGRQWPSAHDIYVKCQMKMITVLGNGSNIYDPSTDTILFSHPMRRDFMLDIDSDETLNNLCEDMMFEFKLHTYTRNNRRWSLCGDLVPGRFKDTLKDDVIPTSVCLMAKNVEEQEIIKQIIISKGYNYRYWGKLGEVYHLDYNKLDGAKELVKLYGKTLDDLVYFGDASNDIDLLREAGLGIAMNNASEEVKSYANMVSDFSNNEDGAIKFLLKLIDMN